jgi:ergothioneine biosynthesis protein EgtB
MRARQQGKKRDSVQFISETADLPNFNSLARDSYPDQRQTLITAFEGVRQHSLLLTTPFSSEEQQIQSMTDASPSKWHLAHTTWFFETFILALHQPDFSWFDERFCYLFNSYYNAVGRQYPRAERGLISRPGLQRVIGYREHVEVRMLDLLHSCPDEIFEKLAPLLVLGLNHEQQHQELIATDIKHALFHSARAFDSADETASDFQPQAASARSAGMSNWVDFDETETRIGFRGPGFCFDNELAAHAVLLPAFRLSSRPVSNGHWLEFMRDGGYENPLLWLSDGWSWKSQAGIEAPLYWLKTEDGWNRFTLNGTQPVTRAEPVRHISYYEADAFASWSGARLPRETEWEHAARSCGWNSNSPNGSRVDGCLKQLGHNWEWTQSAYSAYPGFRTTPGMAGEYNGKFMVNQMVLSRASYRNFFHPDARWQFSGLRLARNPD